VLEVVLLMFIGILVVGGILLTRNTGFSFVTENNQMVQKLNKANWFENHWLAGLFLFFSNMVLFCLVGLSLYLFLSNFTIPYLHLVFMVLGVITSFYLWSIIQQAWGGPKGKRIIVGLIGSSFYLMLTIGFGYQLLVLKPTFPGDDMFMAAIGLGLGITVTFVAFVSSFVFTGLERRK
jgi:hypothetical protein